MAKEVIHESLKTGYYALLGFIIRSYPKVVEAITDEVEKAQSGGTLHLQFNCLGVLGEHLNQLNVDGNAVLHILFQTEISQQKLHGCVKFLRETKELGSIKKERLPFILHVDGAMGI